MATMGVPLKWTDKSENEHHAYLGRTHFVVVRKSNGKWAVPLFSMFTHEPDQSEEKLGEYEARTLGDGKQIAQALADQRGWTG
jgi:hypothetical protein